MRDETNGDSKPPDQTEEPEEQPTEVELSHGQPSQPTDKGTEASQSKKSKIHDVLRRLRTFGKTSSN
jgi:hypothetical protein